MSQTRDEQIVVYGSTMWDAPALTEHHLARALTAHGRVLFVETQTTLLHPLRHGVTRRSLIETLRLGRNRLRSDGDVQVLRILSVPPRRSRLAQKLSERWMRRQVERGIERAGFRPTIVLGARPAHFHESWAARPLVLALVKDWLQAGGHLTGLDDTALRASEHRFWGSADLIYAISPRLQARLRADGFASEILRHGATAAGPESRTPSRAPGELADLPRPVLAAVGRIDARWAFGDLEALARDRPERSLVLVGPLSPTAPAGAVARLDALPNVHRFGPVPGDALATWLDAVDCCLVPYLSDEWQSYASPLKVWDYLRSGKPVVATGAPALVDFEPGMLCASLDPNDLTALVDEALRTDSEPARRRRQAFAAENTWDDRARQIITRAHELRRAPSGAHPE